MDGAELFDGFEVGEEDGKLVGDGDGRLDGADDGSNDILGLFEMVGLEVGIILSDGAVVGVALGNAFIAERVKVEESLHSC